jgi:hypothetical protein
MHGLTLVADFLLKVSQIALYACIFNCLFGTLGAFLLLNLPLPEIDSVRTFLKKLDQLRNENLFKRYYLSCLKYCIAAGIVAGLFTYQQFHKFDFFYSFLYGIAGPFAIRREISKRMVTEPFVNMIDKGFSTSTEIINEYEDTKRNIADKLDSIDLAIDETCLHIDNKVDKEQKQKAAQT